LVNVEYSETRASVRTPVDRLSQPRAQLEAPQSVACLTKSGGRYTQIQPRILISYRVASQAIMDINHPFAEFHGFPNLPIELRRIIWAFAVTDAFTRRGIVHIHHYESQNKFALSRSIPAICLANKESAEAFAKDYIVEKGNHGFTKLLYTTHSALDYSHQHSRIGQQPVHIIETSIGTRTRDDVLINYAQDFVVFPSFYALERLLTVTYDERDKNEFVENTTHLAFDGMEINDPAMPFIWEWMKQFSNLEVVLIADIHWIPESKVLERKRFESTQKSIMKRYMRDQFLEREQRYITSSVKGFPELVLVPNRLDYGYLEGGALGRFRV